MFGQLIACAFCVRARISRIKLVTLIEISCCVLNDIVHCTVGLVISHGR